MSSSHAVARYCAYAALAALLMLPLHARGGGVTVRVELRSIDELELSYHLPAGCDALPLASPVPRDILRDLRSTWKPLDRCGSLTRETIHRTERTCSTVRFLLPAMAAVRDRIYPPAYPIDALGIYAHTGTFAPTSRCGPIVWQFSAPTGSVVFDGTERGHDFSVRNDSPTHPDWTAVYLSASQINKKGDSILEFAASVPGWARDVVADAVRDVGARYRTTFPSLGFRVPATFVTNLHDGGSPTLQADVASRRMLRIGLRNFSTGTDDDMRRRELRALIAHEFAHVLQPGLGDSDDDELISEGGAEFLRWISEVRLSWSTADGAADDLAQSINRCLIATGNRAWVDVAGRRMRKIPYDCGLAVHVVALASRATGGIAEDALAKYYVAARRAPASFDKWIECGAVAHCRPNVIQSLLRSRLGFAGQLAREIERLGIGEPANGSQGQTVRSSIEDQVFSAIMAEDCGGKLDFGTFHDEIEVADVKAGCTTFRKGMRLSGAEGIRFADDAMAAAKAVQRACESSGRATFDSPGGARVKIPCRAPYTPPPALYRIDAGMLFKRLDRP